MKQSKTPKNYTLPKLQSLTTQNFVLKDVLFFWPTNPTLKDLFTSLLASQKARLSLDRSLCSGQQEKSNGLDGSEDMVQVKAVIKRILPHHQTCSLFSSNQVYYLQLSRLLCKSNSGSKNGGNYLYLIKIYENNVHGAVKKQ